MKTGMAEIGLNWETGAELKTGLIYDHYWDSVPELFQYKKLYPISLYLNRNLPGYTYPDILRQSLFSILSQPLIKSTPPYPALISNLRIIPNLLIIHSGLFPE